MNTLSHLRLRGLYVLRFVVFSSLLLWLAGCQTGELAFKQGDFEEAARASSEKLARHPKNKKAAEVFLRAYPQARIELTARVQQAQANEADPFRWEEVLSAYERLQGLSTRAALTPFAGKRGIDIVYYQQEIESARINAANARVEYGDTLMETHDLYKAREAYGHFEVALRYAGQRDDLLIRLEGARSQGTLLVGIDFVESRGHSINPNSMMTALTLELEAHGVHPFVSFMQTSELGDEKAGQYVLLTIGEVSLTRSEAEVGKRDFRLTLEPEPKRPDLAPVEVSAKLFRREKKVQISSPAALSIYDGGSGEVVLARELPGSTVWATQWDVLEGDRRALKNQEIQLGEPADPEHSELMQQLADAIAGQARDVLAGYYKKG